MYYKTAMEERRIIAAALVCLIALGVVVRLWPFDMPYSWDEASYLSLAEGIVKHGEYGWIDGLRLEGQRAPLLPFLLAIPVMLGGIGLAGMFVPAVSLLSLAVLYFFLRNRGREFALFAVAALSVSVVNLFMSQRVLAENLVCLLLLLDTFVFVNALKDKRWLVPFAALVGLTFLAHYDAIAGILPLPFYMLWRERKNLLSLFVNRWVWLSVAAFVLVLAPWMMYSASSYGSLIGAAAVHGYRVSIRLMTPAFLLNVAAVAGFMVPFVALGLRRIDDDLIKTTVMVAAGYVLLHGVLLPPIRYLTSLAGMFAILTAFGVTGWKWKGAKLTFVLLAAGSLFIGTYYMAAVANPSAADDWLIGGLEVTHHDVSSYQEYREAAGLLTGEGSVITSMPSIAHVYTGKDVLLMPENMSELQELADRTGSKYVYLHESPTLPDWVRRLPLIYNGQWVKIYGVSG